MVEMSLLSKVAILTAGSWAVGAAGAWVGRRIESGWALIGLALLFILGAVGVIVAAKVSTTVGISTLYVWTFVSGLFIGPFLQACSDELGAETVVLAFAGTAGVMAVCGGIGLLSGVDFSGMGTWLSIGLLGLIVVGIIGLFFAMSHVANLAYSLFGMLIFSGYFVFDFFRLGQSQNTWENAIILTQKLWLDFINFAMHLLQFLILIKQK